MGVEAGPRVHPGSSWIARSIYAALAVVVGMHALLPSLFISFMGVVFGGSAFFRFHDVSRTLVGLLTFGLGLCGFCGVAAWLWLSLRYLLGGAAALRRSVPIWWWGLWMGMAGAGYLLVSYIIEKMSITRGSTMLMFGGAMILPAAWLLLVRHSGWLGGAVATDGDVGRPRR